MAIWQQLSYSLVLLFNTTLAVLLDKVQSEIDLTHPIIHPSIWASGGATSISDGIILFVCYQWHFVLNTWSVHNLSTEMLNVKLRLQSKTFTLNSTKRKAYKLDNSKLGSTQQ